MERQDTAIDLSIQDLPIRQPAPPDFHRINITGPENDLKGANKPEFQQAA